MSATDLKSRVAHLEQQVQALQQLHATGRTTSDWRAAAGALGNDPMMRRILNEALKYRESDRKRARKNSAKTRRAKS